MKILFILIKILLSIIIVFSSINLFAQQTSYIDNRPQAHYRINAVDAGIMLRYGDGIDSCDIYGAREAIVNKDKGTYYLFYDGAGKDGWRACLAESRDLKTWYKKGAILKLGDPESNDSKSASSPWVIKENSVWHMFYLGTPNSTPAPDRIPDFPYLTMKAKSTSLEGPFIKRNKVSLIISIQRPIFLINRLFVPLY